jgi:hypothetical protein
MSAVRVFRNLTRNCWSVMEKTPKGWRTVAHASHVLLDAPSFHVSEAGRQRVLKTGRKVVHAWIQGALVACDGTMRPGWSHDTLAGLPSAAACDRLPYAASYNPHKCGSFTYRVGGCIAETRALRAASQTLFTPAGVTVSNPA